MLKFDPISSGITQAESLYFSVSLVESFSFGDTLVESVSFNVTKVDPLSFATSNSSLLPGSLSVILKFRLVLRLASLNLMMSRETASEICS